jgi:hypothetical protein
MRWRQIVYPVSAFASVELVTLLCAALWTKVMGTVPDSTYMTWMTFLGGAAALIWGGAVSVEAVEKAEEQWTEQMRYDDKQRERDHQLELQKRDQLSKYMQENGVPPDPPDNVSDLQRGKKVR